MHAVVDVERRFRGVGFAQHSADAPRDLARPKTALDDASNRGARLIQVALAGKASASSLPLSSMARLQHNTLVRLLCGNKVLGRFL